MPVGRLEAEEWSVRESFLWNVSGLLSTRMKSEPGFDKPLICLTMTTMKATYMGGLRVECEHEDSGAKIITDAPLDNHGQGRSFSPTDLATVALPACMLTIMGIYAENIGLDIQGAQAEVVKEMAANPRRIAKMTVTMTMPPKGYSEDDKKKIERAAKTCPVHNTLKDVVEMTLEFNWL